MLRMSYKLFNVTKVIVALIVMSVSAGSMNMTVADDKADIKKWQRALMTKVAKKTPYPRSAIAREIEGSAKVKVTIDRTGAILNFEIIKLTGESVLDKVIPKVMNKLAPVPVPPAALPDKNLTFVIPLGWRLG